MPQNGYNQFAGQRIGRIEALADGVFAIAMTLLVLDIKVPSAEGTLTETAMWLTFVHTVGPKLVIYFLGFMTLGIFWMGHSTQFRVINRTDRHLTWLSIFFLMFISLIPFSTSFLSEHIDFKVAIWIYWLNIFLAGITLLAHWYYACFRQLIDNTLEGEAIYKAVRNRILIAQSLYLAAALLSFINNFVSVGATLLIQLNYALAMTFRPVKHVSDLEDPEKPGGTNA
jgi:uncharacterized membrane protein